MSESNAIANGLAGAGGGIIAQIITYPLQTVNTRQQTERTLKRNKQSLPSNTTTAPGTLLQIFQVIRTEGWGGLYSGLKPSLLGTAASQGIYYYFYQVFKNKAVAIAAARKVKGRGDGTVGMFGWLVVAAIAGSLNVLLTNPIWVLVTRMQTHTQAERKIMEEKKEALRKAASESAIADSTLQDKLDELNSIKPRPFGTIHAAKEVYNEAGTVGFWKGVFPALIMVCNPSIQFMIYESSLKHLRAKRAAKKQGNTSISALESRLQAKQEIGGNKSLRYSGTFDAVLKMIRYEGITGFYKGMSTKIVQSVFAASVLFMIKEELVKAFIVLTNKSKKVSSNLSS
ncbi:peroxisomal nicotinamide adenine dinucleotide carrier-like isoform X2 [Vigna umbellata]|uniref:peroxisomal nicotinamide adenine dinucleotide carrier-like isoform X2 n=1 Tax=Vigna umbellata TaxID=87088 RepID=UPI001F5F1F0C|nr:peroxisomal nicotinamide adenine dinucleotide carrier-like isoform X2 [Vigna umbellata]